MWDTVESAEHNIKNVKCLLVNATIAHTKRQEEKHDLLSVDEAIKDGPEMIQVLGKTLRNFQTIRINTLKDVKGSEHI